MPTRRDVLAAALTFAAWGRTAGAGGLPPVIHLSAPGTGTGKPVTNGLAAIVHARRFAENEFAGQPARLDWVFMGPGVAINEGLANKQIDLTQIGGLPVIISRAVGVRTRLLLSTRPPGTFSIAARANLPIRTVSDLKGRTIGLPKGGYSHLSLLKVLDAAGLSQRDVTLIDLKTADALAAVNAGHIDATIAVEYGVLRRLEEEGVLRTVVSLPHGDPRAHVFAAVAVREDFLQANPDAVARLVRAWVKAAHWASQEENREEVLRIWSQGGTPVELLRAEYAGRRLKDEISLLIDPYSRAQFKEGVAFAREQRLIRADIDVDGWFDPSFLAAALKELGLQTYWTARDSGGTPVAG